MNTHYIWNERFMKDLQNISTKLTDKILLVTIDRPKELNALNTATIKELGQVMDAVYERSEIMGVIITGAGEKAFVAGAAIGEIAALHATNAEAFSANGQAVFAKIAACKKPVIAAVNGFALGGGCELAMACHIRVASQTAKFGLPEVGLGVIPGYGGTQRLAELVGKGKALELIMTGDMLTASEALSVGLVNHLAASQQGITDLARNILSKIITKAPLAVGMAIACVNAVYSGENGYQLEASNFSNCCQTEDFKEGTQAFLEKRKAVFSGR